MSLEQENLRLRKILSGNLGCAEIWSEEAEVQVGRFRFPDSTPVTLRWVAPYSEFKGGGRIIILSGMRGVSELV